MSPRAACAAPGARSWVGWVRVAGAAGVIDALVAWQGQATSVAGSAGTVQEAPLRRGLFVSTRVCGRLFGPRGAARPNSEESRGCAATFRQSQAGLCLGGIARPWPAGGRQLRAGH